jgi:hypothetical protein
MPGETFYYAITHPDGKITNTVEDNVMIYREDNQEFVSIRFGSNEDHSKTDENVEITFFTTKISTGHRDTHFYETMTICRKDTGFVDTFFATYEDKDSEKDSSTTSDRTITFHKESGSTNKYSSAKVHFMTKGGRKVRTIKLMENDMDNEMKEMEKNMKKMKENMNEMKENMNEMKDMEKEMKEMEKNMKKMKEMEKKMEKEMKKDSTSGGMSVGLLRKIFD